MKNEYIKVIEINADEIRRAREFAERVTPTTDYSDCEQTNEIKKEQDSFIGKIGEIAVCKIYNEIYSTKVEPDFNIYDGKDKNWNADLSFDVPVHVKSQSAAQAKIFGLSWTFQAIPEGRTDPAQNDNASIVVFVEVDMDNSRCNVYPPMKINELEFGAPKKTSLIGKKRVVYAKDQTWIEEWLLEEVKKR